MAGKVLWVAGVLLIAAGALALRLPRLDQRPFHGDEAINADKFRPLYERGRYTYDPAQYHGPTLYYLTLPAAWLDGAVDWLAFEEPMYRRVPVVFAVSLVLLTLLVGDGLSRRGAVVVALIVALSPAFVFFGRYYIHEMLLVAFTFAAIACGWRYVQSRRVAWALAAGACLGMMHATKETCIISYAAMAFGVTGAWLWGRWVHGERSDAALARRWWVIVLSGVVAMVVSVVFFSSFFTHWRGPLDSVLCYGVYLDRAGESIHLQPWHYYFEVFLLPRHPQAPLWTEAVIFVLGAAGIVMSLGRWGMKDQHAAFGRFLAFFTVCLVVVYSAIPYKTPWSALTFLHGLVLLAGLGAAALVRVTPTRVLKSLPALAIAAGVAHLGWQSHQMLQPRWEGDWTNPYVYAHPTYSVFRQAALVEHLASLHPDGQAMPVYVVAGNYWPLPWYLRRMERVGWYDRPPEEVRGVPVLVIEDAMLEAMDRRGQSFDGYVPSIGMLRHGVGVTVFIEQPLWDRYMRQRQSELDRERRGGGS